MLSRGRLLATPWVVARQAPLPMGQRALEHLLGWEREGYANCTLVAAEAGDFPLYLIGQDWVTWLPLAITEAGKANISLAQPLSMKLKGKEWRRGLYSWTNNPIPQLFQINFQLTPSALLFHYI